MKTNLYPTPGSRLRLAREHLGITQSQLAEVLRVTRGAVSAWEGGLRRLEGPALVALQAVYGVSTTWLLTGAGPEQVNNGIGVAGTELLYPPVSDSLEVWDLQGQIDISQLPCSPWPISASQAHGFLLGQGTLSDLILLKDIPGLAPMIPFRSAHLLNVSVQSRSALDPEATYLFRVEAERRGLFVRLHVGERNPGVIPLWGIEPPRRILESTAITSVILARVCQSSWRW